MMTKRENLEKSKWPGNATISDHRPTDDTDDTEQ